MSDNEKRKKPKYVAPTIVSVAGLAQGLGYCAEGSTASEGYCTAGTVAASACTAGGSALGAACTDGSAPGA
jgi:dienelactone hydrolase